MDLKPNCIRIGHDDAYDVINIIAIVNQALHQYGLKFEFVKETLEEEKAAYDGSYIDFELKVKSETLLEKAHELQK